MKDPKKLDLSEIIGRLEENVAAYQDLAPMPGKSPVMGIRRYPETFYDNEWELILTGLKAMKEADELLTAMSDYPPVGADTRVIKVRKLLARAKGEV